MDKNLGTKERAIRLALGVILGVLFSAGILHGVLGVLAEVLAFALIFTGILGWCGVYTALGRSTAPKQPAADHKA